MNAHERAEKIVATLRGLPDDECPNPRKVQQSIERIQAAQRRAIRAMEEVASIVEEERRKWQLQDD